MPPALAIELVDLLRDSIEGQRRSHIPAHLMVLVALRLFATGSYQRVIGQDYQHPVSQTVVSRCFLAVTVALVAVANRYIRLPRNREERLETLREY